jgi:replication initiation and membrane attachment protein
MKISNLLHFTENHRFYIYRDFSMGTMDYKMLSTIYQPMVGAGAVSLFHLLYQQVAAEQVGFSPLEQQRKLFLAMDLEPSERGRNVFIDYTSKLEAVGLLLSSRKYLAKTDEYIYEYQLSAPLLPSEFFKNQHLMMLLRDKVGKYTVISYSEQFHAGEPEELRHISINTEDISVPFYELFELNAQVIDYELEQALLEIAPAVERQQFEPKGYLYAEIIARFPRESYNRTHVENLQQHPEQLAAVNYIAAKYKLSLQETCRLLDEDGIFSEDGQLHDDLLQTKANLNYRQSKKRDDDRERHLHKAAAVAGRSESPERREKAVEMAYYLEVPPMFIGQCDIHQYNMTLRNEPYTRVLELFFPGSVPDRILDIFAQIDLNYKLNEEVINVLIHYLKVNHLSWTKRYIDAIAGDMLGKQLGTYEQAVQYVKDAAAAKQNPAKRTGVADKGRSKQKPRIPIVSGNNGASTLTESELEEMRKLAQKLDGKK